MNTLTQQSVLKRPQVGVVFGPVCGVSGGLEVIKDPGEVIHRRGTLVALARLVQLLLSVTQKDGHDGSRGAVSENVVALQRNVIISPCHHISRVVCAWGTLKTNMFS